MLEGFSLFHDWLVVEERCERPTLLHQIHRQSGEEKCIAFDDPYTTWLVDNPDPEDCIVALWLLVDDHRGGHIVRA